MLRALLARSIMFLVEEFLGLMDAMRCSALCKSLPSETTWSEIRSRLRRRSIQIGPQFARSFGVHVEVLFTETVLPLLRLQTDPHEAELEHPQEVQGRQVFVRVRGYKQHRWVRLTRATAIDPTKLLGFFRNPAMDNALRNLQADGSNFVVTKMSTYHERDNLNMKVKRCRLQAVVMGFEIDILQRAFYPVGPQLPDSDAE